MRISFKTNNPLISIKLKLINAKIQFISNRRIFPNMADITKIDIVEKSSVKRKVSLKSNTIPRRIGKAFTRKIHTFSPIALLITPNI